MTPREGAAPVDPVYRGRGDQIARWLLVPLLVALAAVVLVFFVFFRSTRVAGPSMLPGLRDGDYLLVTQGYRTPVRGDIVVVTEKRSDGSTIDVIKRVVGIPGDTVEVSQQGSATVNGSPEPAHAMVPGGYFGIAPLTVPAGAIFILGDNRADSTDSRVYGPVPLADVRGRAVLRFAPITRLGWVR